MKRIIALLLLTAAGSTFAGQTVYVDDRLEVMLRTGKGTAFQILRVLPSGTPLELLKADGDYTQVRTSQGVEGWVLSRFLTQEPIARDRLADMERKLERMVQSRTQLNERIATLEKERDQLSTERNRLQKEKDSLQAQLAELEQLAASPRRLANENRQLQGRIETLEQTVQQLDSENGQLRDVSQRQWFVTGAGVLGGGIVLGLLLPLMGRRKRRSGWGEL